MEFFRYVFKRLISSPFIILGLVALVFIISRIIPADPVAFMAGELASPEQVAELKQQWGLDQPLYIQFAVYLKQLAKGDLGISLYTRKPVIQEIMRRLPATLELTISAVVLSVLLGVPLGVLTALWRNSWLDHLLRTVSIGALSIVGFWLGIMLQLIFGFKLGWLPLTGRIGLNPPQHVTGFYMLDSILTFNWTAFINAAKYILLPAIAIALESFATILRFTRAGVLNVIQSDYVLYERAMGLPNLIIIGKYVLRNAITTPVTQVGLIFAQLLGGAVVIETVFDWPGIGIFLVNSIIMSDYKVILGVSIWIGIIYIVVNLIIDVTHTLIDPRRVEK